MKCLAGFFLSKFPKKTVECYRLVNSAKKGQLGCWLYAPPP